MRSARVTTELIEVKARSAVARTKKPANVSSRLAEHGRARGDQPCKHLLGDARHAIGIGATGKSRPESVPMSILKKRASRSTKCLSFRSRL